MVFRQANIETIENGGGSFGEASGIITEREQQYSPPKRSQNLDVIAKPTLLAQAGSPDCNNQVDKDCKDIKPHGTTSHPNNTWNYWLYNHLFGSSNSAAQPLENRPGAEVKEPTMKPAAKPGETHVTAPAEPHVNTPAEPHVTAPARPGIFGRFFGGHSSAS